jgi:hypothetical protein
MSPIYVDYNATKPLHPLVAKPMLPYWRELFGSPKRRVVPLVEARGTSIAQTGA